MKFRKENGGFTAIKDLGEGRKAKFTYAKVGAEDDVNKLIIRATVEPHNSAIPVTEGSYDFLTECLSNDMYEGILTAEDREALVAQVVIADKRMIDRELQAVTARSVDFEAEVRKFPESLQQAVLGNVMGSHAARLAQEGDGQGQGAAPSV